MKLRLAQTTSATRRNPVLFHLGRLLQCLAFTSTLLGASLEAHADSVVFNVNNIAFTTTSISGTPEVFTYYGSAQFTWTYTAGNFANGAGVLNYLDTSSFQSAEYPLITTADLAGITTSVAGNIDNAAYDVAINFAPGLTGPTSHTIVTGGSFDISNIWNGEWVGNITGGTVDPAPAVPFRSGC